MLAMGRATRNYRHGHPALTRRRPTLPAAAATSSSVIEVVEGDCIDVALALKRDQNLNPVRAHRHRPPPLDMTGRQDDKDGRPVSIPVVCVCCGG
jgi:hypothetical protein